MGKFAKQIKRQKGTGLDLRVGLLPGRREERSGARGPAQFWPASGDGLLRAARAMGCTGRDTDRGPKADLEQKKIGAGLICFHWELNTEPIDILARNGPLRCVADLVN